MAASATRLTHSRRAFARRIQMSNHRLWVMVEGWSDRAFYDRLLASSQELVAQNPVVCLARELPGGSANGKKAVVKFFKYLRRKDKLRSALHGVVTNFVIAVDKDLDDLRRAKVRSTHAVYTEFYAVENYLVRNGRIADAIAAASGLDLGSIAKRLGPDSSNWRRLAASTCMDWIAYCVLLSRHHIVGAPNYGSKFSLFCDAPYGPANMAAKAGILALARANSGWTSARFNTLLAKEERRVRRLIDSDKFDIVFNGKWYFPLLAADVEAAANAREYDSHSIEGRIRSCLLLTLEFSAEWADNLRASFLTALA